MEQWKYARAVNATSKDYELLLHGIVGWEIEGPAIAREIKLLNDIGAENITLRINSVGGYVNEGLSVVAAMLSSKAAIHTFNEGTADSMASIILCAGDEGKRGAYDYATSIVHDPLMGGITLEDIEDEKVKGFMRKTKDTMLTIYENNTGKSREEISQAMTEEVMMSAEEQRAFGLIDFVKASKKRPKIKEGATPMERMAACSAIIDEKTEKMDNKNIEAVSKELATAAAKIEALKDELTALKLQVEEKDDAIIEKDDLIERLQAENKEFHDAAKRGAVNAAISSGKFDETDREFLENQCDALGVDEFTAFVDKVKEPQVGAMRVIEGTAGKAVDPDDTRTWDWAKWEREDPHGLALMAETNPERYNKLLEEDARKYKN